MRRPLHPMTAGHADGMLAQPIVQRWLSALAGAGWQMGLQAHLPALALQAHVPALNLAQPVPAAADPATTSAARRPAAAPSLQGARA